MLNDEERKIIVQYRIDKADETLIEARDCGEMNHWTLAANRLYYAVHYASSALLIQNEIYAKTHEGVIGQIGEKFVLTGVITKEEARLLARLQNMRKTGDYDDFIEWHREDVEPLFEKVEEYINKIKTLVEPKL